MEQWNAVKSHLVEPPPRKVSMKCLLAVEATFCQLPNIDIHLPLQVGEFTVMMVPGEGARKDMACSAAVLQATRADLQEANKLQNEKNDLTKRRRAEAEAKRSTRPKLSEVTGTRQGAVLTTAPGAGAVVDAIQLVHDGNVAAAAEAQAKKKEKHDASIQVTSRPRCASICNPNCFEL